MGIFSFLKGGKNPAPVANAYLQEIPRFGREAYEPFINQGRNADEVLAQEYARLLQNRPEYSPMAENPIEYLNYISSQYEPSVGFQSKKKRLGAEAAGVAAAGGFRGAQPDVDRQSELINSLLNEDMQQFIANVLGIQQYGQGGQERQHAAGLQGYQGVANRGFQAASNLGDYLGSNMGQQAGLQFQGRAQQNANQNALLNAGLGLAAGGLGAFMGGRGINGTIPGQVPQGFVPLTSINYGGQNGGVGNFGFANRGGYGAQGGRPYGVF